ncbi:MAG: Cna B-type domain-containing protein [Eubacteriales bacterium]|nr:Cna B-type domain-containing protein [Eubacteriales bacterium]
MKVKKALCFLFALIMLLSFMPTVQKVYAEEIPEEIPEVIPEVIPEETTEFDVSGSKTADPTELEGDDRETTVTLSLPSAEYQNKIDVVFVMDSSSSARNGSIFIDETRSLFNSVLENNPGVVLKVGVILFRGDAHDAIDYFSDTYSGLTEYNENTKDCIETAVNFRQYFADQLGVSITDKKVDNAIKAEFGNGSGAHCGLDIADEWLADDGDVPDSNKYVVFLTDGKTYIWHNEDNKPTCIYTQYYNNVATSQGGSGRWTIIGEGVPQLNQSACAYKDSYPVDVLDPTGKSNIFWFNDYEDLYNYDGEEHIDELSGKSPWDAYCTYADDGSVPTGTGVKHEVTNGAALFGSNSATFGNKGDYQHYWEYVPDAAWNGVPYLEANPLKLIEKDGSYTFSTTANDDGTFSITKDDINPNYYMYHVDGLQKSMYLTGHLWDEMNSKYNCAVITYSGGGATGFVALRNSFIDWLQENSQYGADIETSSQIEAMFEEIDNDIRYMVSSGVVTDQITDDFTLKNEDNKDAFRMTRSGEALTVTYADGKWNFGTNVDGVYPYVVEYDADTKTITWTINVPIENANPVTLSYDLILREDAGSAFYDTNVSAVLDYVTTDGKEGSYFFEVPKVSYIKHIDIPVEKQWDDYDNEYDTRPESITVNLLAGEELVKTEEISEGDDDRWTCTFKDLPDSKLVPVETADNGDKKTANTEYTIVPIEYTVEEAGIVAGYKTPVVHVIEGEVSAGVLITNTLNDLVKITYILNGGVYNGDTSDIVEEYPIGVTISIHEAPTREGFRFLYWKGSEYDPGDEYTVTEDHEFVAQWEEPAPQTGEENRLLLWILIMAIAYIDLFSVMFIEKKRRMNRSHE